MLGISFLFPAFLLGALAVAVPVVLHLMKRDEAPRMAFSAVQFLRRAPVAQARRKRLQEMLLLALRVMALLLLAGVFARPFLADSDAGPVGVTIIGVDTSLSMGPDRRFEEARTLSREAVAQAPPTDRVGVLTFGDGVTVLVEPSVDRSAVLAAVDRLVAGFGTADYGRGLTRAGELLGGRPGRIVMVTDLQRSGWDPSMPARVNATADIRILTIGESAGNLAVEAVRDGGGRVIAAVRHSGSAPTDARLSVRVGDAEPVDVAAVLASDAVTEVQLGAFWPARGVVETRIDDPTGVAGDNVRFRLADPPPPIAVLVVGDSGMPLEDAFYLVSALRADGESSRFVVDGLGPADVDERVEDLERHDIVVLVSTLGLERRAREAIAAFVRGGGGALVALGPSVDPAIVGQLFGTDAALQINADTSGPGEHRFGPTDLRHPIFRPFAQVAANLGRVRFSRTAGIRSSDDERLVTLARFDDGSGALVEQQVGDGRVVWFGSDLDNEWNDFPLHPGFVPFLHEAVRHVSQSRVQPSDVLVGDRPAAAPEGPGVLVDDRTGQRVVVNVDPAESSVERLTADALLDAIERTDDSRTSSRTDERSSIEQEQGWWRYGLILLLVALAAEGLVGARVG